MKLLTTIALIAISYFVVVIIALHFLRDDLNPVSNPTSQYAVGRYGFLMTTAFISMSVASFSLLIGLYKEISKPAQSRIGLILLGIWAAGVLVAMLFPINPEGTDATTTNIIHRINGPLVFLSLSLGAVLVSKSFRKDVNWRPFYRTGLTLSLAMLLFFVITGVNVALESGFEGLCQRVFLVVFSTWFILTVLHLRSVVTKNQVRSGYLQKTTG